MIYLILVTCYIWPLLQIILHLFLIKFLCKDVRHICLILILFHTFFAIASVRFNSQWVYISGICIADHMGKLYNMFLQYCIC